MPQVSIDSEWESCGTRRSQLRARSAASPSRVPSGRCARSTNPRGSGSEQLPALPLVHEVGALGAKLSSPGALSIQSVCAWMAIRNASGPRPSTRRRCRSTPRRPSSRAPCRRHLRLLGRPGTDRPWPRPACPPRRRAARARAAPSWRSGPPPPPAGNCWLEPGSSVTRIPFVVDSRLSGWWISSGVLTGLSSPSTNTRQRRHLRRVVLVEHHLPDAPVRGPEGGVQALSRCAAPAGVGDVDDVAHAGRLS